MPRRSPRTVGHAEPTHLAAVSDKRAEAQKVLDKLNGLSKQNYAPAAARVGIYVGLGEKGKASEWLEKALGDRSIGSSFARIKVDPVYDPLRSGPGSRTCFAGRTCSRSVKDGSVTAFIPGPESDSDHTPSGAVEGVGADSSWNFYGAEVVLKRVMECVKK